MYKSKCVLNIGSHWSRQIQQWRVFNGTTVVFKADSRQGLAEAYAPGTINVPSTGLELGVNEWRRISWKDTRQSTLRDRKNSSDMTVVEIETTAALTGALYLSGFGIGPL